MGSRRRSARNVPLGSLITNRTFTQTRNEAKNMRRNGNATLGLITGTAIGGTLMYLADSDRGNRRRALARERAIDGIRQFGSLADKGVRDLRNSGASRCRRNLVRSREDTC